ncbi:bifunctional 4-hydroxy-2-oxoglutarate aldolase/2-dehydro-3-deoxy-phosphogluconate aldolase [Spirochaeta lutea]|uniref:bifunctional 4-hydroxy-2-oxoglutarate aldolase/2-dehydro-3-deoxy-phosphogluconate aldolase n=1 Tax=Spirochaeta lutea TaxID=1480694 RepID=UPI000562B40C|nr:bifunctional 4-hydroxy-2-oxoglutarate aldolase/2-dehydro-3-deoxy-phosphogluconate aldolase [Spirochaeta lutea]
MNKRSPQEVFTLLSLERLIPLASIENSLMAITLADRARSAGFKVLEFTFRVAGAAEVIRAVKEVHPELLICAGTVLHIEDARAALDAGAELVVSPGFNADLVRFCLDQGAAVLPGVATPTEVEYGIRMGLTRLKLFPAGVLGGPSMLQALSGPYPGVRFVPTGGIGPGNLLEYLSLPNVLACAGSWMVPKSLVASQDWDGISRHLREAILLVR